MPRYIVAITKRSEFAVEACSADEAIDAFWLDHCVKPSLSSISIELARREPQLLLSPATARTYKIEYRHDGRLVFEHVTKRSSALAARSHARKIEDMLSEMSKPVNEVRVRELPPETMLYGYRRNGHENK